jgi:hypothetical protein
LLTQDRYDGMKALQELVQPHSSWILPDTAAPVMPSFDSIGNSLKPSLQLNLPSKKP